MLQARKKLKIGLLFCLMFGYVMFSIAGTALAQTEYKIEAKTDRNKAVLGEQIVLTVTISSNTGTSADPVRPDFDGFDVAGTSVSNNIMVVNGTPRMDTQMVFALRPVKLGKLTIGEFVVNYTDNSGMARQAKTVPISIEVVEEEKKKEAEPPADQGAGTRGSRDDEKSQIVSDYMKITTAVIIVIFASIWVIAWQSSRREKMTAKKQKTAAAASGKLHIVDPAEAGSDARSYETKAGLSEKPLSRVDSRRAGTPADAPSAHIPSHDIAGVMKSMQKNLVEQSYKELFGEMARFIKLGLSARSGRNLMEMTTRELSDMIDKTGIPKNYANELSQMLELCDMVCYAKYEPARDEVDRAMNDLNRLKNLFERGAR